MSSSKHEKIACTNANLLVDIIYDFKDVIISYIDELLGLTYMNVKLKMFSFYLNLNYKKIPYIMLHMV